MSEFAHILERELQRTNCEIDQLRNQLREALADTAEVREEARRKMHNFAREFRAPLTSVLGFTDLLSVTYKSNSAELNQIAKAGHQLMDLVSNLEKSATVEVPLLQEAVVQPPGKVGSSNTIVHTVLHIEDNEPNFRLVEIILEDRANIELSWAPTGEAGIALACQRPPSLILLDLNLPDIHGSEVLARLRGNRLTASIPVIVLSADVLPSQIERMLQAGARNYLTKPFEIKRLLCLVDESLALAPQAAA
jgi:CheY-like chemotaxis protein